MNEFYLPSGSKKGTTGAGNCYGIVVKKEGDAVTLAHEIGHSLGLCDIYVSNDEAENNLLPADVKSVKFEMVRRAILPWYTLSRPPVGKSGGGPSRPH